MDIKQEIESRVNTLGLSETERPLAVGIVAEQLYQRVGIRIAEELPEQDLADFNTLAEADPMKAMENLDSKLPNFESLVREELQQVIEEYALLS